MRTAGLLTLLAVLTIVGFVAYGAWGVGEGDGGVVERGEASSLEASAPAETMTAAMPRPQASVDGGEDASRTAVEAPTHGGVWGVVWRGRVPAAGRKVCVRGQTAAGQSVDRATTTASDGSYRFELEPGHYSVLIPVSESAVSLREHGFISRRPTRPGLDHRAIDITDESVHCDFHLPRGRVEVVATEEGSGVSVAGAKVWVSPGINWPWYYAVETDATGRAVVDDLPFGEWAVSAVAEYHVAESGVTTTLSEREPAALVALRLQIRSTLALSLVDDAGERVEISAALRLSVRELGSGASLSPTNRDDFSGGSRPLELLYERVPAGRYRIQLEDERSNGGDGTATLRFQPVDAVASQDVVLSPGRRTETSLRIRYRSYVRLRGTRPSGAFDSSLRMRIHPLDERYGKVRVLPGPWQAGEHQGGVHFDGYLAPGVYLVSLTGSDGRRSTERLAVGREPITRAFAVPDRD